MIRSIVKNNDGHTTVLLGLEPQNMARLREGQPVKVNLRNIGPGQVTDLPDIDVVVFFAGKDETKALMDMAVRSGADVRLHTEDFPR